MGWKWVEISPISRAIFHILTQLLVQRVEMDTETIGHG
jgi:hypothetical protein